MIVEELAAMAWQTLTINPSATPIAEKGTSGQSTISESTGTTRPMAK